MFAYTVAAAALLLAPAASFMTLTMSTAGAATSQIKQAEQEAIALTQKFGVTSPQAVNAWDTWEELAASDNTITQRPSLDESCEVENMKNCEEYEASMAELQALINGATPLTVDALMAQNKKLMEENIRLRRSLSAYK